jgi:hypothetical protein
MKTVRYAALLLLVSPLFIACPQQTDPRAEDPLEGESDATLVGTLWAWDAAWGYRTLEFVKDTEVIYIDGKEPPEVVRYSFDGETGTGRMDIYGPFSKSGKYLQFSNWNNYGHGAEYILLEGPP